MNLIKKHLNSVSVILIKMSIIVTLVDLMLNIYEGFEFYDFLLSIIINCVGVFFVYGLALKMPPVTKTNPLSIQDDIVDSIYSEAVQGIYLVEGLRGIFRENSRNSVGNSPKKYKPIHNAEELFINLNTYQTILVNIDSEKSKKIYNILDEYKTEAKYMVDNSDLVQP